MKKLLILIMILVVFSKAQAQPVSFYVHGDADDWQLFMSGKIMADLADGGKVVCIILTAGDEGKGNTSFNSSPLPYYLAREKGAVYSAKFANDIAFVNNVPQLLPVLQTANVNGHILAKYVYKNIISYFLRLPEGNANGSGFPATGNVSLKKLKDGSIGSITSVDGSNTYTGWGNLTSTIAAIINAEKGANSQVWLNTSSLDVAVNPNDYSDHIYSATAAQDAVNSLTWVGINEFINDHSFNLSANLSTSAFQNASAIFGFSVLALVENNYPTKFTAANKAWLPMDYYSVKRNPLLVCAAPTGLTSSAITHSGAIVSWGAVNGATNYTVEYKLASSSAWASVLTTATTMNLTGLASSSLYNWRVRANCASIGSGIFAQSQFSTVCPDILEPNETYATAKTINAGNNYSAKIASNADKDYYQISNNLIQRNIRVRLTNLPADYDLRLYSPSGGLIATSQNRGLANEEIIYNSLLTYGAFRVNVFGYNGAFSYTNCYTLRVDLGLLPFFGGFSGRGEEDQENEEEKTEILRGGIKIYPVPATTTVNISFDAFTKTTATIIVSNQLGQEVIRKTVGVDNGINITSLDVSNLRPGIYSVKINNGTNVQVQRLQIAR
ncbi:MAG TPA: T9SS type A sorting domain-containing protein [Ferruginibacter sp.]|nr:T9SS type A sorting domain-containing protein [Ferruginibacter sp.]